MNCALIMAGGSGERFWPLSTKEHPKQVLSIFTGNPLIVDTVERILPIIPIERIFIATNIVQKDIISKVLPSFPNENFILEPMFKDTAAAIGFGSLHIKKRYPDAVVAVFASDHIINNNARFLENISMGLKFAQTNHAIVTLGIKVTRPDTGYGYLEVNDAAQNTITKVINFREKPDLITATHFYESNRYLWNSGIFIFSIQDLLNAFETYAPEHYRVLMEIDKIVDDPTLIEKSFQRFPKISIDYAIMEKHDKVFAIPSDIGWSDVGDFNAISQLYENDIDDNVCLGSKSLFVDSSNNVVVCMGSELKRVSLLGVKNMVISYNNGELLIASRFETQRLKELINKLFASCGGELPK